MRAKDRPNRLTRRVSARSQPMSRRGQASREAGTAFLSRREPWEWALAGGLILALVIAAGLAIYSATKDSWHLELRYTLSAAPETVHRYLSRPEKRVAWEPGVIDVAKLTGDQTRAGATRMVYMRSEGRRWHQFEELEAFEAGARLAVRREAPNADRAITVRLEPRESGGTRLIWREEVRFTDLETQLLALWELRKRRQELRGGFDRLDWLALKGESHALESQTPRSQANP